MKEPIVLKKGDPCPGCGGDLAPRRAATVTEWAKFSDRENPEALPAGVDTMNPALVVDHGQLHVCGTCGYKTRFQ